VVLVEVAIDIVWFHIAEARPFAVAEGAKDVFLDVVHAWCCVSHDGLYFAV
jgi:hypothetical protein